MLRNVFTKEASQGMLALIAIYVMVITIVAAIMYAFSL